MKRDPKNLSLCKLRFNQVEIIEIGKKKSPKKESDEHFNLKKQVSLHHTIEVESQTHTKNHITNNL